MTKEDLIFVGSDLHKETHTAVMINCYNQKLGEITFPNRPANFPKLVAKVKKCNTDGKEVVYGLENAYGYGRSLAVWLLDKGYLVKDVFYVDERGNQNNDYRRFECEEDACDYLLKQLLHQKN